MNKALDHMMNNRIKDINNEDKNMAKVTDTGRKVPVEEFYSESEFELYQKQMEENVKDVERIMKFAVERGFKFPFYTIELRKFCLFFGDLRWVDSVIFSEDFAVAFFGGEKKMRGKWFVCYEWQQHLQKMAIIPIEERIKYLLGFL